MCVMFDLNDDINVSQVDLLSLKITHTPHPPTHTPNGEKKKSRKWKYLFDRLYVDC
jgi:hypothetical protein